MEPDPSSPIRNVSDTALWVALYRAQESARIDAHFQDPFAERLAGHRGKQILANQKRVKHLSWPFVARTYLFDLYIQQCLDDGVTTVINLAAGLDTRPYRMNIPGHIQWIEADLPDMIRYKEEQLDDEAPTCQLKRYQVDLSDAPERRKFFSSLQSDPSKTLVLSEGLLVYLGESTVVELSNELNKDYHFKYWIIDLGSPALVKMMNQRIPDLGRSGVELIFGPVNGLQFFENMGWSDKKHASLLKTSNKLKRIPFFMRLFAMFPDPKPPFKKQYWSAVCLLENSSQTRKPIPSL